MAANVGGRMIGICFAWVTTTLAAQAWMPGNPGPQNIALVATIVADGIVVNAFMLSFRLPEPTAEEDA
ncbi:MAG: hypothetical protein AB7U20_00520 [Planctomycetaceae bacterium]